MASEKSFKKSKYFKDLEERDYQAILRCLSAQIKKFYKDEIIVHDGDPTTEVYIIYQGSARSYTIDIEGNRSIIADYHKDSVFGCEYNILKQKLYHEHLVALEDTTVIACNAFRFINPCQNRCKRHIDFMRFVFEDYAKQLNQNKRRVSFICETKTRDKVLAYIRTVKSQTKKEYFSIPYNRQELADYLGVERTALSAELSKMKAEGLIDFDKNYWRIKK